MNAPESAMDRQGIYRQLMRQYRRSRHQDGETRWRWLMAAHIVGQHALGLHWHSHRAMLRHAIDTRDLLEAAGQCLRLLLVPLGHGLGRLPAGNTGRATVSAFEPMPVAPEIQQLIAQARDQAAPARGSSPA